MTAANSKITYTAAEVAELIRSLSQSVEALQKENTALKRKLEHMHFVGWNVMPGVDALPVKVPFPRHEPSALFAELPSQHRITEICKNLEGIFQTDSFQRRRAFKDPHILLGLCGDLRDRPKLPIHLWSCNIR